MPNPIPELLDAIKVARIEDAISALRQVILHYRITSEEIAKIERMIWQLEEMLPKD